MIARKLLCTVFMPFRTDFTFVYALGIMPALEKVGQDRPYFSLVPQRADEYLVLDDDKVKKIVETLTLSDLVIADITGHNPNVLWELGFSHALEKPALILSQSTKDLPFNIRTRDVLQYELSVNGMEALRNELTKALVRTVDERIIMSLSSDPEIYKLSRSISRGLASMERDSILRNLAKNEMSRFATRIKSLQKGKFDLRNEKPNKEIIDYFCDYVHQLDSSDSQYDTISILDFWKEITDDGHDFRYLMANIQAARAGARIRRVFLVDAKRFTRSSVINDKLFRSILTEHYYKTREYNEIETKVLFTQNYDADVKTYKNLAVWKKGQEKMLFVPEYKDIERSMTVTLFTYCNAGKSESTNFHDNMKEIEKYEACFREVWARGEKLIPEHFEK